ncbi:integrase [Niastella koreensis]|uniref:Integrase family protein n=2 Tax=Niastella koreensis TaxID=354356 RepID=G8T8Z6_NIAKG|nr:integrase arm-type DNA-binding domain-containing protein [Niastella koreensis]AEW02353.1 integrase family protein [Niastella koreensis GR20-10]OQP46429.1 integrase [Niastella koreensis]
MSLSDMQCRAAKPQTKPYKLFDSDGLYLEVLPSGVKSWRLKYSIHEKEKRMALGIYPNVPLIEARQKKTEAKALVEQGLDPILVRIEQKQIAALAQADTFEKMALEWYEKQIDNWKSSYAEKMKHYLERYIFHKIGGFPLHAIKPLMMLNCLQEIEKTNPDMSRRLKGACSQIFKYAIATGRGENDPTYGLEVAFKKFKKGHYASITVDEFPDFIVKLYDYRDRINRKTFLALRLMLLTFVRTQELIHAKKTEFDLINKKWVIPGERMKRGLPHIVPLSRQAVEIVKELITLSGYREYLLPGYFKPREPMCNHTLLMAIKRMGYKGRMTGHGFRSLALGILKEKLHYSHDVADRQLAHVPKSSVDRAYDRAQFLPQRIEMMQNYADYIDKTYLEELARQMSKT